ncbi:ubiquinone biosynthesis accessory factor UbiJ [Flavobacterium sp. W21_SRS_FM6]|uniref:ubiquinone biosynthesis accessory factor UbiJ n=1 Tax=Flavobacterium sp. W21_SRS_FM6 TaxID=3240268 RepID=UPI003F91FEE4
MPFAQLVSSGLERALNKLLQLDPDSAAKLRKLKGRNLQVRVRELPWPLIFHFSDEISLGVVVSEGSESARPDCLIELNLETLPLLQDSSQLSALIQQQKLILIGDIYVAQSFSNLIKELDIDWEEQLARVTNDVFAHQTFHSAKSVMLQSQDFIQQSREIWAERLTKEGAVGINQQTLDQFSEDVVKLRSATDRLAARLAILEKAHKA